MKSGWLVAAGRPGLSAAAGRSSEGGVPLSLCPFSCPEGSGTRRRRPALVCLRKTKSSWVQKGYACRQQVSSQREAVPRAGTRHLFTLLEGDAAVAKNNCLHQFISLQGGTWPFLTRLGCATGHIHDLQARWLLRSGAQLVSLQTFYTDFFQVPVWP